MAQTKAQKIANDKWKAANRDKMRARGRLARRVQMEKKHPPDNSFMVARAIRYLQRAEAVTHPDVPPLTIP